MFEKILNNSFDIVHINVMILIKTDTDKEFITKKRIRMCAWSEYKNKKLEKN